MSEVETKAHETLLALKDAPRYFLVTVCFTIVTVAGMAALWDTSKHAIAMCGGGD